jgi:hypothetical protein
VDPEVLLPVTTGSGILAIMAILALLAIPFGGELWT